jgi:TonB family protein
MMKVQHMLGNRPRIMKSAMFGLVVLACALMMAQATPAAKTGKIYHIGGDVKPPRAITSPQPATDEIRKKIKEENAGKKVAFSGSTTLLIVVGEDGSVRSVKVLRSLNRDLDAKAIDAVKQWKFEPATKKGTPVSVELAVQIDFHLYK